MEALRGTSHYTGINLDIGHFVAANFDPLAFIEKHHARIFSLHLKDRKKNQGADVRFGEGDTPIREVLQLLKRRKWDIPSVVEFESKSADPVAEVGMCLDYCRRALA
jgi:sugar phosphate isomerase/epimerase